MPIDGLVNPDKSTIDDLNVNAPFSNAAVPSPITQTKQSIDPARPISSLSDGEQQITILRDTNHGSPLITGALLKEIEDLAAKGTKKIIFEFELPRLTEIKTNFPEIIGKSVDEAEAILESKLEYLQFSTGMRAAWHASNEVDPDDSVAWNEAHEKALKKEGTSYDDQVGQLNTYISTIRTAELLDRWNKEPPQAEEQEIRGNSKYWEPNVGSLEDRKLVSNNFAEIIIRAKDLGMEVHFAGDNPERKYKYARRGAEFEKQNYINENPQLHNAYLEISTSPEISKRYADNLRDMGKTEPQIEEFFANVSAHEINLEQYDKEIEELSVKADAARFSDEALEDRAKRFSLIAGDDKTVVLWGNDHFDNSLNNRDINEYLDDILRDKALKDGTLDQFVPTKTIELIVSRDARAFYEKIIGKTEKETPDVRYYILDKEVEIPADKRNQFILTTEEQTKNGPPCSPSAQVGPEVMN